jgi:plastocyanin
MSADSHLSHTMDNAMAAHDMSAMTHEQAVRHAGIPGASDPHEYMRAMMANAAAEPASSFTPSASTQAGTTVRILPGAGVTNASDTYDQKIITIKRDTTIAWVNTDPDTVHNVGDDGGAFKSTLLKNGDRWSYTYNKKGTFPFHCLPHPWMKGTVIVK